MRARLRVRGSVRAVPQRSQNVVITPEFDKVKAGILNR
jgi:hypothetical protein